MKKVGRENTAPELAVRRYLHACGLRFRVHDARLPGRPDIVLARRHSVVFVHGCFWHGHGCAHGKVRAKTNIAYWDAKIHENRARDARKRRALLQLGWKVETIWECQAGAGRSLAALAWRLLNR
ncbi:MAG: DNA mismatch endonuclease Vsr [Burkholderiales bacterium]|nr:DNA mismatch endonuclease Vsr [Burkholderiales bacterium]MDE2396653.1 DNA mismatch endonuclease Vsr [Burkholderiales bacterium]MDE2452275.1 DNA mismatch endonuclease Vsr [Burkholderiales bacterium]